MVMDLTNRNLSLLRDSICEEKKKGCRMTALFYGFVYTKVIQIPI